MLICGFTDALCCYISFFCEYLLLLNLVAAQLCLACHLPLAPLYINITASCKQK